VIPSRRAARAALRTAIGLGAWNVTDAVVDIATVLMVLLGIQPAQRDKVLTMTRARPNVLTCLLRADTGNIQVEAWRAGEWPLAHAARSGGAGRPC
jgi:hypothetical protein